MTSVGKLPELYCCQLGVVTNSWLRWLQYYIRIARVDDRNGKPSRRKQPTVSDRNLCGANTIQAKVLSDVWSYCVGMMIKSLLQCNSNITKFNSCLKTIAERLFCKEQLQCSQFLHFWSMKFTTFIRFLFLGLLCPGGILNGETIALKVSRN